MHANREGMAGLSGPRGERENQPVHQRVRSTCYRAPKEEAPGAVGFIRLKLAARCAPRGTHAKYAAARKIVRETEPGTKLGTPAYGYECHG